MQSHLGGTALGGLVKGRLRSGSNGGLFFRQLLGLFAEPQVGLTYGLIFTSLQTNASSTCSSAQHVLWAVT